jgi:hypothetical protein
MVNTPLSNMVMFVFFKDRFETEDAEEGREKKIIRRPACLRQAEPPVLPLFHGGSWAAGPRPRP